MDAIETEMDLERSIQHLEFERTAQRLLLKQEFYIVCEKLKPINIIKDTWQEAYSDPDIKSTVTNNLMGIASGTVARKIILGKTNNYLTRLLGTVIERFVSKSVVNNADKIKSVAGTVFEKITNKHD